MALVDGILAYLHTMLTTGLATMIQQLEWNTSCTIHGKQRRRRYGGNRDVATSDSRRHVQPVSDDDNDDDDDGVNSS